MVVRRMMGYRAALRANAHERFLRSSMIKPSPAKRSPINNPCGKRVECNAFRTLKQNFSSAFDGRQKKVFLGQRFHETPVFSL